MQSILRRTCQRFFQSPIGFGLSSRSIHTTTTDSQFMGQKLNIESSLNKPNQVSPQNLNTTTQQIQYQYRYYSASPGDVQTITVEELASLDKDSYQLIDVRQQHEWDEDYVEGATLVPLDTILNNEFNVDKLRSKPCIVYCKAGIRSNMACTALRQFGVRAVNLEGGIMAVRDYEAAH